MSRWEHDLAWLSWKKKRISSFHLNFQLYPCSVWLWGETEQVWNFSSVNLWRHLGKLLTLRTGLVIWKMRTTWLLQELQIPFVCVAHNRHSISSKYRTRQKIVNVTKLPAETRHFYHQSLLLNSFKWFGTIETCRTSQVHKEKKLESSLIFNKYEQREECTDVSQKISHVHTLPYCTAEWGMCHKKSRQSAMQLWERKYFFQKILYRKGKCKQSVHG